MVIEQASIQSNLSVIIAIEKMPSIMKNSQYSTLFQYSIEISHTCSASYYLMY